MAPSSPRLVGLQADLELILTSSPSGRQGPSLGLVGGSRGTAQELLATAKAVALDLLPEERG